MVAPFDIYVCNTHHTTIYISCFSFFILDFCDKLYSDDLQFGYKYKSSTSVPGWLCRQFLSSSRNIHLSMLLRWTVAKLLISVYFLNTFVNPWQRDSSHLCSRFTSWLLASKIRSATLNGILNGTRQDPVYSLSYLQCTWTGCLEKVDLVLRISSLVLCPTVMIFCCCLLHQKWFTKPIATLWKVCWEE